MRTQKFKTAVITLAVVALGAVLWFTPQPESEAGEVAVWTLQTGPGGLARFDAIATAPVAAEETKKIEGSVADGEVIYVTESRGMLFLTSTYYTTARIEDGLLTVLAPGSLRRNDRKTSRARIDSWLAEMATN